MSSVACKDWHYTHAKLPVVKVFGVVDEYMLPDLLGIAFPQRALVPSPRLTSVDCPADDLQRLQDLKLEKVPVQTR